MNNFLVSSAGGTTFIVLLSVLTVAAFALMVWLVSLGVKGETLKLRLRPKYILLILVLAGAAVRMGLAFYMRGLVGFMGAEAASRAGYTGIFNMTNAIVTEGFNGFIDNYGSVMIYPVSMYILAFFGSINSLFAPLAINSELTLILLKLPFVISDILLAIVVYKIAEKYAGEIVALALGGFVAVCPIFMLGAIWPSVYSFFALTVVLMLYFMIERKYISLLVCFSISLMICFEAIFLLPVVAVYLIYAYVRKVSAYRKSGGADGPLWKSEYGLIVKLPVALLACVVASYLLTLPFALDSVGANPFVILYVYLLKPFDDLGYFTYNGLSLYSIFGKNGVTLNLSFPNFVFSLLFVIAVVVVTLIIYLSKKNRATFAMYVAYLLLMVNVYFVNSSELTLLPCLAALMIAIAVLKDKRLVKVAGILALTMFVNAAGVLVKADYFIANASFASELLDGTWQVLNIVTSAIGVLTHIYFTVVLLDIVINNRFKKFETSDNKFMTSMKNFIKIKD